ncbi:MAG: TlpA disulfide reductase family protein [Candidatus Pedobacter colombiensis]|uniref:TlpA disulfide reductase family protein n=1 Tax=Candidatus Pedobacter colombiensis TaxID=3121371 RepID=A0AAJ5W7F6_9SPHI|nr:TlpA disulfide reductase family protein [Pedobacter sp.]WEK18581.1 MAG: TlpA disulfide reductase family protein [Pedobacter sp.]
MKPMKIMWTGIAMSCFLPLLSIGQGFSLSGKIGNLNAPAKIYLSYYSYETRKQVKETLPLKNGEFSYKGINLKEPLALELVLSHDGSTLSSLMNKSYEMDETLDHMDKFTLFVENGKNVISAKDSISKAVIAPSKIELERKQFEAFVKTAKDKMKHLNLDWTDLFKAKRSGNQIEESKYLSTLSDLFLAEREYAKQCVLFAKKYPTKFYAGVALNNALSGADRFGRIHDQNLQNDALMIKEAYNLLSPTIKKTIYAQSVIYSLEDLDKRKVNVKAINFVQNTVDDKPIGISDFKGKYVFVDFWASWCGPCRGENPNVLKAYNMYKDAGLEILGVSFDDKKEAWIKAIKEDGMPWTQISALKGFENEAAKIYNIQGIPSSLLINPEGEIIAYDLRGQNLEKKLADIFKR